MYHDEYDVHCRIVGTPDQIDALIMTAALNGLWSKAENIVHRSYTPDQTQMTIGYVALNEKIWDIEHDITIMREITRLATKLGLTASFTSRRCH